MFPRRTLMAGVVLVAVGAASPMAQQSSARPVPMRPPLSFSESWKSLPTPPDDHNA